jgi:hypothetical protein
VGCKVQGSKTIRGVNDSVYELITANYRNWTLRKFRNIWSPATGPGVIAATTCQEDWECNIGGTFEVTRNGIYQLDPSTSDPNPSDDNYPIIGPFISYHSIGTITNMAGMVDPRWEPGSSETSDDAPILPGPCFPMWHWQTQSYEGTYDSDGILTGSHIVASEDYYSSASGCGFGVADDSTDSEPSWFTIYNEYGGKLNCSSMTDGLAALAETLWPTDDPSDTESLEGTDLDATLQSSCGAMFECRPCEVGRAQRFRYRWTVPLCHPGSYYRIDWDEVFFPQAYLDWLEAAEAYDPNPESTSESELLPTGIEPFDPNVNPPPVLPTITPKSWTWTGEALGDCEDWDSNYSDSSDPVANDLIRREAMTSRTSSWSNTVYVPAPGITEVRNVRVRCYDNPFGTVAQPVADANAIYDPDDVDQDGIADSMEPLPLPDSTPSDSTSV